MVAGSLLMFVIQVAIVIGGVAIVVALMRWALRINEIVTLQREILAHLRHINANTKPDA